MSSEIINGLFALGGALIGVLGAWLVSKSNKQTHKLTLIVSPLAKLLDVGDLAKSDVKITYKGEEVEELCAGEVAVQNSGNTPVEDIEFEINPTNESQILDLENTSSNFSIPEGFIEVTNSSEIILIRLKYLNPKDRVVFGFRITGSKKPNIELRKKGLDVETKYEAVTWIPDIYAEIIFEAITKMGIPGLSWYLSKFSKPFKLYLDSKRKKS